VEGITAVDSKRILYTLNMAYQVVAEAITVFSSDPKWSGKEGGCFCLADEETGFPYATMLVGNVPKEKLSKYFSLCQEKAARLASHPEDIGSWESRNPEKEQWGGAIRFGKLIYSFSGSRTGR